jgi:two-component system sensor histidine kinase CpxA
LAKGSQPQRGEVFGWFAPNRYVAQATVGPSGRHYVLVAEFPLGPHLFFGPGSSPWLGIFIALISSGLVCFFLARYLTGPVVRLRAATKRLADGDLTARAGIPGKRQGGDEIAQLVSDFDTMAGRIEDLVNAQSRLLNDISHELRSPLARLNVALGLARQRSGAEMIPALDRMELEATRLNELIGRLLALARLEGGGEMGEKLPVRLADLIANIAADASYEAQGRNCQVKHEVVDDCIVLGNPALLNSAIENVVRNAMRYTQEGTDVDIRLECAGTGNKAEAVIRVSDRGPGVPEVELGKLFRPFYRIDDARGRQTGGIGLGLAITERAVRLHGGSAHAANRPGGGLTVELRLPALRVEKPKTLHEVPAEA